MNKNEVVSSIAEKTGMTKKDSEKALVAFLDTVVDELSAKGKVQIVGFGTFETTERAARTARNPQTGEIIEVAASVAPKFKAGKALKDAVKNA